MFRYDYRNSQFLLLKPESLAKLCCKLLKCLRPVPASTTWGNHFVTVGLDCRLFEDILAGNEHEFECKLLLSPKSGGRLDGPALALVRPLKREDEEQQNQKWQNDSKRSSRAVAREKGNKSGKCKKGNDILNWNLMLRIKGLCCVLPTCCCSQHPWQK